MRRRRLTIAVLALGTVLGFGSGFARLYAMADGGGWHRHCRAHACDHDRDCDRDRR